MAVLFNHLPHLMVQGFFISCLNVIQRDDTMAGARLPTQWMPYVCGMALPSAATLLLVA